MRVLILSDSHGRNTNMQAAIMRTKPDEIIHCGDGDGCEREMADFTKSVYGHTIPFEIVRGNNDFGSNLPMFKVLKLGRHTVFLTHGHRYRLYGDLTTLAAAARENGANYAFFGHTHIPEEREVDGVTCLNPGSISFPRQSRIPTYVVADVDHHGDLHFKLMEI